MDLDNIGDFLYLILIVVFGIIGAVTRKKKKPQERTSTPGDRTSKDLFESLFPDEDDNRADGKFYDPDEVKTAYEPVSEVMDTQRKEEQDKEAKRIKKLKRDLPEEGISISKRKHKSIMHTEISDQIKHQDPVVNTKIVDEIGSVEVDLLDEGEIKKAIIYSEILKAKYIDY